MKRIDFRDAGGGEERCGGKRRQRVKENENPGADEFTGEFFAEEFEFVVFARLDDFVGDFRNI